MQKWSRLMALLAATAIILLVVYTAFYFVFLELFVDLWWFRSLEYEGYFWLRLLYRFFISGGITLTFFLIFFLNFWVASRYLGFNIPPEALTRPQAKQRSKALFDMFVSGSLRVYTPLSVIMAVIIAIPFYDQWEAALLFIFGPDAGVVEPVYSNDVSFYMFSYPIFMLIQQELLVTASILFISTAFLYWLEHSLLSRETREYPLGAKIHLTSLVIFVFLIVAWGFMLQRFSLLYVDNHEPVFFGPGFVELRYHLPLIWMAMISFLFAAMSLIVFIHTHGRSGARPLIIASVVFVAALGLRNVQVLPKLIRQVAVQPNPVTTQKSFMENNITATSAAYDLDRVQTRDFKVTLDPTQDIAEWIDKETLNNIPLWDRELLLDVYQQLQGIRPYYSFTGVDEDRYPIRGHTQQVNLAPREMNITKLPEEAQNWENRHLRYTHGYGAVMSPAAQLAGEPIQWYMRDLNLHSDVGINVAKPDIYYGLEDYNYAIVPNELVIPGISSTARGEPNEAAGYVGEGGIPIPSLFRKLLFAFYHKDEKIFFSLNINRQSRLMMRRNVVERISAVTPYLALDGDPYLVAMPDAFYWIQDAYTISDWYPVSKSSVTTFHTRGMEGDRQFNYIRNAVKVVVNAYDGKTRFYISDSRDPIIRAYQRAYPGLFKPMSDMPKKLKAHLRYPRDLFYLQMKIYAKYHQVEPELFYQQAETWQFATIKKKDLKPYYLTTVFPGCEELERFVLINPMTPIRRNNLSVLAVAAPTDLGKCGDDYTAQIVAFKFRKDVQVNGPAQIDALIDQDPEISAQLTLWDQHGSKVERGRMIILPMSDSVLYVQPIYLISTQTRIPELVRVIVSMGNRVVMDTSLSEAFKKLGERYLKDKKMGLTPMAPALVEPPPPETPSEGLPNIESLEQPIIPPEQEGAEIEAGPGSL